MTVHTDSIYMVGAYPSTLIPITRFNSVTPSCNRMVYLSSNLKSHNKLNPFSEINETYGSATTLLAIPSRQQYPTSCMNWILETLPLGYFD
ncbi:unnamed protein product [Absidia cylindrospora]